MISKKYILAMALLCASSSLFAMGGIRQFTGMLGKKAGQTVKELIWPEHYEEERKIAAESIHNIAKDFLNDGDINRLDTGFKSVFSGKPHLEYARLRFENGEDPLYLAITAKDQKRGLALLQYLLQRSDIDINLVHYWKTEEVHGERVNVGETPLQIAIGQANADAVKALLKYKGIELGKQGRRELSKQQREQKALKEYGEGIELAEGVHEEDTPVETVNRELNKIEHQPVDKAKMENLRAIKEILNQTEQKKK